MHFFHLKLYGIVIQERSYCSLFNIKQIWPLIMHINLSNTLLDQVIDSLINLFFVLVFHSLDWPWMIN